MPSVNQHAIAKKLNLSRATVSRSLANHPAISPETRALVHGAAEELGYQPSPGRIASRRAKGRDRVTIGVMIGVPAENVTMATFPHILKGIRQRAAIERVKVDVYYQAPGDFHPETGRQPVFRQMREAGWRGAILIYPFAEEAVAAVSRKLSTVALLECYEHPGIDIIDNDDPSAVATLVDRLAALGHRRIGFLSWHYPVGGHWIARRFSGYVQSLFVHGLEFRPEWTINVHKHAPPLTPAEVAARAAELIRRDGLTAWVCAADHQAYPLIAELRARGLRVPEDCSVTGFDGLEPPPGLPALTSMQVPHEHIGAAALTRLINRLEHPATARRRILVESELIPGSTIAPPRPS
jgi:LacI family transcriptional regulator